MTTTAHRIRCHACHTGHDTVAGVRACQAEFAMWEAQAAAEQAAEAAAERYWEEGTEAQQIQASFEAEEEARHCWR